MNAYELAKEMDDACIALSTAEHWVPIYREAANMLRQQADRIAGLEKLNANADSVIGYLRHEKEKLEKQVQWHKDNDEFVVKCLKNNTTPQTKPLSDEEMYREGVMAVFNSLLYRAANHFHGNPEIDKQCQAENNLIIEWAMTALEEVSPKDHEEMKKFYG
jgi:hypothetical protein